MYNRIQVDKLLSDCPKKTYKELHSKLYTIMIIVRGVAKWCYVGITGYNV